MSGQLSNKYMSAIEIKSKSYFSDKWYIREDLFPEQFQKDRDIVNCQIMYRLGNCFNTKEEAVAKCNAIRLLLNVPVIDH